MTETTKTPAGGMFLLDPVGTTPFLVPEKFNEDQRLYYKTADDFVKKEILPNAEKLDHKQFDLMAALLKKAGENGLLMASIPPKYGGLGLDETTVMLMGEAMAKYGSWSVSIGGHTGIGSLPIVWFGNEAQKQKYLPKLSTGEWLAAYALSEPGAGSDALAAKTIAKLSPDKTQWILNGTKAWITNAGFADIFIVFAKVDGEKFSGFIVEKGTPGFSLGREETKIGLWGSSTRQLIFEDAKIPVENLLGEIGRGHKIAFNILNNGRLKLGIAVTGGAKYAMEGAIEYAKDRKAFGKSLSDFTLIREKLAQMTALIYANESMSYRTVGYVDGKLAGADHDSDAFGGQVMAAAEEYAIESSILKVFGSEMLSAVIDEALQIHGGYGYTEEYPIARSYRDARVNRIFEGTNEINRMLIPGMFFKRAAKGFPLMEWFEAILADVEGGRLPTFTGPLAEEQRAAEMTKRIAGYAMKVGVETFGLELEQHQDILASIADACMEAYAIDSMVGRTLATDATDPVRLALCKWYAHEAWSHAARKARKAICATVAGDDLKRHLANLEKMFAFVPTPVAELRETIVTRVLEAGKYPFAY